MLYMFLMKSGVYMQKLVNLGAICDLLGVLHHLPKRSTRITAVCRVLGPIDTPIGYKKNTLCTGTCWVRVGLLFGKLELTEEMCADNRALHTIRTAEYPNVFFGCANVVLPTDYTCYMQGNKDILISGKIYADALPYTQVTILQWTNSFENNGAWLINSADVHPLDMTEYPEGIRALYMRLQRSNMNDLIKKLYDTTGITPCGVGKQVCINDIIIPKATAAYWDSITDDFVMLNENERNNMIAQDPTLFVAQDDCITLGQTDKTTAIGSGITQIAGRQYYNRTEFVENDSFISRLNMLLEQKTKELTSIALPEMYIQSDIAVRYAENIVNGIRRNWVHVSETVGVLTGSELCEQVFCTAVDDGLFADLLHYVGTSESGLLARMKIQINLLMGNRELMYKLLGYWCEAIKLKGVPAVELNKLHSNIPDITDKFVQGLVLHICEHAEDFLLLFIQEILHLKCDLLQIQHSLTNIKQVELSLWRILPNPYLMAYYGVNISISDMDTLAMVMGVMGRENVQRTRMVAFVHSVMCDASSNITKGATLIERKRILQEMKYQTPITDAEYKSIQATGLQLTYTQRMAIQLYLGVMESARNYGLHNAFNVTEVWGHKYKTSMSTTYEVLTEYCKSPLGVALLHDGVDVVMDVQLLDKEVTCYNRSHSLANAIQQHVKIEQSTINKYITQFEKQTATTWGIDKLTLEYKQRQVAEYVNSTFAAVVGGAGTGKTTSAALLLYVLQQTRDIKDEEVLFVAPTGKAAVRLKESVKRPTMTIHRACSLPHNTNGNHKGERLSKYKAIFIDEASLISLNVMTSLLSAIDTGTFVYFFGDIAQLPPIDIGKPFALMLHYMPCITLEISKRATEGSLITKNSNILMSSTTAPLYTGSNYIIADIPEVQAMAYVEAICRYHLYGEKDNMWQYITTPGLQHLTSANDLMVITPVKNSKYSWGCTKLNARLQTVYNKITDTTPYVYTVGTGNVVDHRYYVGDKVVHLTNQADELRYSYVNENSFSVIADKKEFRGVMNGELGTVRYIIDGEHINFLNTENGLTEDSEIAKRMRQKRKRKVYMFVEYTDVNVETSQTESYLICYPLNKRTLKTAIENESVGYCVEKETLNSVESAYALTVHKLEGSQASITICLCYDVKAQDFLNNNLLQTMLTRAGDGVYLIGDIRNAFSKARKIDALKMRKSIFDAF